MQGWPFLIWDVVVGAGGSVLLVAVPPDGLELRASDAVELRFPSGRQVPCTITSIVVAGETMPVARLRVDVQGIVPIGTKLRRAVARPRGRRAPSAL